MSDEKYGFSRYLPADLQSEKWGWRVLDAGRQAVPAGVQYPVGKHPHTHHFNEDGSRMLDEFQVVFIAEGEGSFFSHASGPKMVTAGDVILVFPGAIHSYRPTPDKGWTEYWVGFSGTEAARLMGEFFAADDPVIHLSYSGAMLRHFDQLLDWLRRPVAAKDAILAGHLPLMLALIRSGQEGEAVEQSSDRSFMLQAKAAMLSNMSEKTDLEELAADLGMSYSKFRFAFKRETGFSPRDYENLIKLNRARDMMLYEGMSVSAAASALGYASVHYFSRAFKQRFGKSPRDWVSGAVKNVGARLSSERNED